MSLELELSKTISMIRESVVSTSSVSILKETYHQVILFGLVSNLMQIFIYVTGALLSLYMTRTSYNKYIETDDPIWNAGCILSAILCFMLSFCLIMSIYDLLEVIFSPNVVFIKSIKGGL